MYIGLAEDEVTALCCKGDLGTFEGALTKRAKTLPDFKLTDTKKLTSCNDLNGVSGGDF